MTQIRHPAYRSKTLIQASFWIAAILVATAGYFFDEAMQYAQHLHFVLYEKYGWLTTLASPLVLLFSATLVVKIAPYARGSGIPQALKAMMISLGSHQTALASGLITIKTAIVKVASAVLAVFAGASVGREGPTVQVAASLFAWVGSRTKRIFPHADFHSYLVAGSAAGVSAAFNTPLAGITFALEEMAEGTFAQMKQSVMISVVIAGMVTQTVMGNYSYFGSPVLPALDWRIALPAILIGLTGGLAGGLFARSLAHPIFDKLRVRLNWWHKALICGVVIAGINLITNGDTAGTGYHITRAFMDQELESMPLLFPIAKFFSTLFSFWSGTAGGIFSPSLSIGAGLGNSLGVLLELADLRTCALLGMVAFFTGTVQAPLTGVVIIMEMTNVHEVILPLMLVAFVAQGVSKLVMPTSLYHYLAHHRMQL